MLHNLLNPTFAFKSLTSPHPVLWRPSQDTMEFAQRHGIVPRTVVFDGIDKAPEAYEAMRSGLYRVVIRVASD